MKTWRSLCGLILIFAAASATAQVTSRSLWQNVPTQRPARLLEAESPTNTQLTAIRAALLGGAKGSDIWQCEDQSWLTNLTYSKMPVTTHSVLLVEAGSGCARGGQGANGAMWLIDIGGAMPRLIAAPGHEFNGWLYGIQPEVHRGFHDIVLGWHMSAAEAGLSYFQFDGSAYKRISSATLITDEDGVSKIVPAKERRR